MRVEPEIVRLLRAFEYEVTIEAGQPRRESTGGDRLAVHVFAVQFHEDHCPLTAHRTLAGGGEGLVRPLYVELILSVRLGLGDVVRFFLELLPQLLVRCDEILHGALEVLSSS